MLLLSIFMVILLGSDVESGFSFSSIFDIDGVYQLTKELVSKAQFAADRGESIRWFDDRCEVMLGELLDKVDDLSEKMDIMNKHVHQRMDRLEYLINGVASDVQKKNLLHKMIDSMKIVFERRDEFITFSKEEKLATKKFKKFLQDVVSTGGDGVEQELKKIHRIVVRGRQTSIIEETILDIMVKAFNIKNEERCNQNSPQHSLYLIYTTIISAELTGLTTMVYSAKILEKETLNNETDLEIKLTADAVNKRIRNYADSFHSAMKNVDRSFRTCDPDKESYVRDETFVEMWGLTQVILLNEWKLFRGDDLCDHECNVMYGERPNMEQCAYQRFKTTDLGKYEPYDFHKCPFTRKCYGWIHSCITTFTLDICKRINETRRYDFIRDTGRNIWYGKWTNCNGGVYDEIERLPRDFPGHQCTNCLCLCDDDRAQSLSVHVVNLRESSSQHELNRVVVGVRFHVEGSVLQLQVKEGEIGREYSVDPKTVQWRYFPEKTKEIELAARASGVKNDPDSPVEGKDYHMFKSSNVFNMNKVLLDYHRVIVGVRFAKSERKETKTSHIEIQIKSMAYNPATGKLLQGTEEWGKTDVIHNSQIDVGGNVPQHAGTSYVTETSTNIKSGSNQYVKMRASNWGDDGGQTVLPLFDAHTLELEPPAPMGGLGMHYRAPDDTGGLIGLSGYALDYVGFLDTSRENQSLDPKDVLGPE